MPAAALKASDATIIQELRAPSVTRHRCALLWGKTCMLKGRYNSHLHPVPASASPRGLAPGARCNQVPGRNLLKAADGVKPSCPNAHLDLSSTPLSAETPSLIGCQSH